VVKVINWKGRKDWEKTGLKEKRSVRGGQAKQKTNMSTTIEEVGKQL